jgi:hypothetical protein
MKPGDLIVVRPGYTESQSAVGMILRKSDLKWHARTIRYDVLFPEGVFPMYDYEMQLLDPEPVQDRGGYVTIEGIGAAHDETR